MGNRLWIILYLCVAFVGFSIATPFPVPVNAADNAPYKIGYIDGLTGPLSDYAKDTRAGVEIAVDEINKKGGILGRKVEVIIRDDKVSPEVGLSSAKDLVFREKVDILVGVTSSGVGLAVSGFAKEQKIPFISTIAVSENLTGKYGHRYYFRMNTNTHVYAYADAMAAKKLNIKKWWILSLDYEYGHACVNAFKKILKEIQPDVEFVGESWAKLGNNDYTPVLTPIAASDAEGLFEVVGGSDFIKILKDGSRLGLFKKVKIVGHDLGMINTYYALGKSMPEGIWGGTQYPFWDRGSNPRSEFLYQEVMKSRGRPPGNGAPSGYEAIWAIARAAEKAGTTDTEKLIDTLEEMTFDTVVGPIKFRKFDHQAVWPFWFGKTKYVPEYPKFPILVDTFKIQDEAYQSEEEIMKARESK